jgi:hypothetical protein
MGAFSAKFPETFRTSKPPAARVQSASKGSAVAGQLDFERLARF